jgi:hypothetical protein
LKQLSEGLKYVDPKENILINFYGDKQLLKAKLGEENQKKVDDKQEYLVGKYKDVYIGCLSINNPYSREKFGLNKYYKDYFYIGQWNNNQKNGIGFLKITDNILYLGEFLNNQLNGFGMLYYKDTGCLYFGSFNNGEIDKGIYHDTKKRLIYHGSFKDGKKNDKLCSYFDINNKHLFVGEVKDDIFIRGYLLLCEINEFTKSTEIYTDFSCDKFFYFDKSDPKKIKYEYNQNFENELNDDIGNLFLIIFEADYELCDIHNNYIAFFENLENIIYCDSYTDYIERYNPEESSFIENTFIKNYKIYYQCFLQIQNKIKLNDFANIIMGEPKINKDKKYYFK